MNFAYTRTLCAAAFVAMASAAVSVLAAPAAPAGIKTVVEGTRVDLSWSNGDAGTPLLECGFEDDAFPPQGWSAKVTNSYDYLCSWFHYPSDQFKQTNNWEDYIHTGEKSAMSYIDIYAMKGDHDPAQDEWLMTPAVDGASYLELYYFIDPTVLEYGADEFFPDHYYVKVSYDEGKTWETLWDARYEAHPVLGWHSVALPLKGEGQPMVAFESFSADSQNVYFLWALDDVRMLPSASGSEIVDGYTIMLDGEKIAEHVKSLEYMDVSPKSAGVHRYEIFAESGETLSPAASAEVTIADIKLLPPVNVKVDSYYDDMNGSYNIVISWDAPEGGVIEPIGYNIYGDGAVMAEMLEETSFESWGYSKGVYDFRVTAVYQNPDGESEPVGDRIAIDTRLNAHGLKADLAGGDIVLSWEAPEKGDVEVSHYVVWRGEKCISTEVKELSITDTGVPAGKYRYYVNTVFADGEESIPAYLDVDNGDCAPRTMMFSENFDSCHLPADWEVMNLYDSTPDNLLWQFDDPNGLNVTGDGFDKGFASIDCVNSGFYYLIGGIATPPVNVKDCNLDQLAVSYVYDFAASTDDTVGTLEIERDGNGEWEPVEVLEWYEPAEDGGFNPVSSTVPLADYVGDASSIRLRWVYQGMFDYHLAIDNVVINDGSGSQVGIQDIVAGDISVKGSAAGISISAPEGITAVEIYSIDGKLLKSLNGNGSDFMNISFENKGVTIVNVSTPSQHRVMKIAR